jgi:putative transposase
MILTYRYRVKDRAASTRRALRRQARSVNFLWNYLCEIDRQAHARWKAGCALRRPSAFDLMNLCRGVTNDLGIHSDTVDAVCARFVDARTAIFPKTPRFRSARRNLDWIPFSNFRRPARLDNGTLTFLKRRYCLWYSRPLPDAGKPKSWNLASDSRGRWYVNIQVEVPEAAPKEGSAVGVDLGLTTLATLSDGRKIAMPAFYRKAEAALAKWQRYGKRQRVTALTAKVRNLRRHFLHVISTGLVRDYGRIVVGDASPSRLCKTRMAKSVHDAGWDMLRQMLRYKAMAHGASVEIVDERWSSATCSACGARSGPKGIAGLRVRSWNCSECGVVHDRDANAALNILASGRNVALQPTGIPVL